MTFDAIVIGAGHNGLTLSLYLQRAGLSTAVVEADAREGGLSRTDEPLLPGYRHNPHANFLSYADIAPVMTDFRLADHGLRTVTPEAQHGICFSDGRPPVVLHRNDLLERSLASIGRYSQRDAEVFRLLKVRVNGFGDLLRAGLFAPADRAWFRAQADAVGELARDAGVTAPIASLSSAQVVDMLFEADEVRALFYQLAAEFGVRIDEVGGAISFLGFVLWLVGQWRLPLGGMQAFPSALRRAAEREGVTVLTGHRVEGLVVRTGRVTGVRLAGRGFLKAERLVASSASVERTLLAFARPGDLSKGTRAEVERFAAATAPSLASLMFCLKAAPAYKSAAWDADIDRCFHTMVGFDDAAGALEHLRDVDQGRLPAPAAAIRVNTLWDPSQAPAGAHVAGSDAFFPDYRLVDEADWDVVRASYDDAFLKRWAQFAPNMTAQNVLAEQFSLPQDYTRKMLFKEGMDQYRTDIRGLYLCGASTYPGGGVHGACAYNAFQTIAADLALPAATSAPPVGGPQAG